MADPVETYKLLKYDVDYQLEKIGSLVDWVEKRLFDEGKKVVAEDKSGHPQWYVAIVDQQAFDYLHTLPPNSKIFFIHKSFLIC